MNRAARRQVACIVLAGALAWACNGRDDAPDPGAPDGGIAADLPRPVAVLEMEGLGTIHIELLSDVAPRTVERFSELASGGHYDGTTFHRVEPELLIQGGDPLTRNTDPRDDGKGGTEHPLPDEFSHHPFARGSVALANKGRQNSANGQFFIALADLTGRIAGEFTLFGRVVEGMDVVEAVTRLEIDTYGRYGPAARPYPTDARITRLTVEPPKARAPSPALADNR